MSLEKFVKVFTDDVRRVKSEALWPMREVGRVMSINFKRDGEVDIVNYNALPFPFKRNFMCVRGIDESFKSDNFTCA